MVVWKLDKNFCFYSTIRLYANQKKSVLKVECLGVRYSGGSNTEHVLYSDGS